MSETQAAPETQSTSPAPAKAGVGRFVLRVVSVILIAGATFSTVAWVAHGRGSAFEVGVAQARETPTPSVVYRDGPPLGFSGGFGEDHCQACHTDGKLNVSPGSLSISAPARYSPGETYAVTITLKRPRMAVGGFQLTARFEDDSAQAGTLAVSDSLKDRMKVVIDRGIQYAYHSRPGTELTATGVVRWTLRWTAPAERRSVVFHVAANAANGDDSQFGDFIYTTQRRARSR